MRPWSAPSRTRETSESETYATITVAAMNSAMNGTMILCRMRCIGSQFIVAGGLTAAAANSECSSHDAMGQPWRKLSANDLSKTGVFEPARHVCIRVHAAVRCTEHHVEPEERREYR